MLLRLAALALVVLILSLVVFLVLAVLLILVLGVLLVLILILVLIFVLHIEAHLSSGDSISHVRSDIRGKSAFFEKKIPKFSPVWYNIKNTAQNAGH